MAPLHRKALMGLDRKFFAAEENLNLMSSGSLADTARAAGLARFGSAWVILGWPTNLLPSSVKARLPDWREPAAAVPASSGRLWHLASLAAVRRGFRTLPAIPSLRSTT